eukprot:5687837-Amphidinium_carterae.1
MVLLFISYGYLEGSDWTGLQCLLGTKEGAFPDRDGSLVEARAANLTSSAHKQVKCQEQS